MTLELTGSPFALTADAESSKIWAGRPQTLSRLRRLARSIGNAPESSLDVLWANFGAGKTHALLYLKHLLSENGVRVAFAYVEIPENTRKFTELYRRIVASFDLTELAQAVIASSVKDTDLLRACQVALHGTTIEKELVESWLTASPVPLPQLRSVTGITTRIDDDTKAVDKLIHIVNAFASQGSTVVICLDEFQRLTIRNPRDGVRIMQHLRTVLSHCPKRLSIVSAIASRAEQTALSQLPAELRTLIGLKPSISLPPLNEEEALVFLQERLSFYRPLCDDGCPFAPFSPETALQIVARVRELNDGRAGPRQLLQASGWVYNQLEPADCRDVARVGEVLDELRAEE